MGDQYIAQGVQTFQLFILITTSLKNHFKNNVDIKLFINYPSPPPPTNIKTY